MFQLKKKSRSASTTNEYCDNFIKISKKYNFEIIEIHNRPLVFNYLKQRLKKKFILYFHNNPLEMKGSKSSSERLFLLRNVDKLIFISKWVQKQIFRRY